MIRASHYSERFSTLAAMRPPGVMRTLAWMITLTIPAVVAFLLFVPWVQTAPGRGVVTALDPHDRVQQVTALLPGRVEKWYVNDGQTVKEGDPIARIVDNDPDVLVRMAAERAQVLAQIDSVAQAMAVARLDVGRTGSLYGEGLASRRDYESAQIKVAEHAAKLAEAKAKLSRVDIALNRQSMQVVRAPREGRIQAINANVGGSLVSAGDWLATLAPEQTDRVVELQIDGRDVAMVRRGQRVRLNFEGWPAIQFSGWPSVAQGMFDGRVRSIDPSALDNGLFRVLVEPLPGAAPWPDTNFVRLGSKVRGWIQMETVSVGYELWRQLNDFPLEMTPRERPGPRKGLGKALSDKGDKSKSKDSAKEGYEEEGK
ncbi:HlyD family secretion protein [Novosphingobium cyanobacteriorum]|uniref:HlyD family efflux transporter periplasmic adaptor subunit n=1 Tax=Novosphingobium cyanobacteriorum TaxID=3024215 RepID=A0ABT6CCP4_9SPHN|nr:HlyD family efflux transporter periplasmic adaptor subunit [Novosphingobium cyanobacteriorum]MDF8331701.1 HlyD family efflux transporter periplasmic adaptor subunit [Novosphingobium cyanobacteriorum]